VKIATQNAMLVAPIFLLLALISSLLLFFLERSEVRWGLDSEAQGLALTIAEFTDGAALSDQSSALRAPLDRILQFSQARRIDVFEVAAGQTRPVLTVGTPGEPSSAPPSPDTLRRVLDGESVSQPATDAGDRLVAYSPIRDGDRHVRGIAAVRTSLEPLHAHRDAISVRTATISAGLLAVGCLVSLVISRIISKEIGQLTRTARAFASGDYEARIEPGTIDEVAVVGSTFGIMGSVLHDATERATREMLQLERFNTESDLVECYAARFAAPINEERGGVSLAIDRLGEPTNGDFWFSGTRGVDHVACLGRIVSTGSLDDLTAAASLGASMEQDFAGGAAVRDVLSSAADLFHIHCCMLLCWSAGATEVLVHRLDSAGRVEQRVLDVGTAATAVLTTLEPEPDRRATRYSATYSFESPIQCVNELQRFLGSSAIGGVLALQLEQQVASP
jgi:HAMP domain-containing protein